MKILVTGGSGLIGNNLISRLLIKNVEVYSIDRNISDSSVPYIKIANNFTKNGDICDLPDKIDCVVHLAQSRNFRDFENKSEDVYRVNTVSTCSLLSYAKRAGASKFIYASTGGLYLPTNKSQYINEKSALVPNDKMNGYYASKYASEVLTSPFKDFFSVSIMRFFFVYGDNQHRSMLIPRIFDSVKNGNEILLNGEEGLHINPTHVQDATDALIKSIDIKESDLYNIAGPDTLSIKTIADTFGAYLKIKPKFKILPEIENDSYSVDIHKMSSSLITPQFSILNSVKDIDY